MFKLFSLNPFNSNRFVDSAKVIVSEKQIKGIVEIYHKEKCVARNCFSRQRTIRTLPNKLLPSTFALCYDDGDLTNLISASKFMNEILRDSVWQFIITVSLALIALLISIYLAYRQGVFKRGKLFTTVSLPTFIEEAEKETWLILFGIPNLNAESYSVCLPYVLINKGNEPLRNLWIQISYPYKRYNSTIQKLYEQMIVNNYLGMKRFVHPLPIRERMLVDYEISLMRPDREKIFLQELVTYSAAELFIKKQNSKAKKKDKNAFENETYVIDTVTYEIRAENHKHIKREYWLVATPSQNLESLVKRVNDIARLILQREKTVKLKRLEAMISKTFKLPFDSRFVILAQSEFVVSESNDAAEAIFMGKEATTYQKAEIGMIYQ